MFDDVKTFYEDILDDANNWMMKKKWMMLDDESSRQGTLRSVGVAQHDGH